MNVLETHIRAKYTKEEDHNDAQIFVQGTQSKSGRLLLDSRRLSQLWKDDRVLCEKMLGTHCGRKKGLSNNDFYTKTRTSWGAGEGQDNGTIDSQVLQGEKNGSHQQFPSGVFGLCVYRKVRGCPTFVDFLARMTNSPPCGARGRAPIFPKSHSISDFTP